MLDRNELVTTALLGTDRRPGAGGLVEENGSDPATALLDQAARSALAVRAGQILVPLPAAAAPIGTAPTPAPVTAQAVLDRLLARPQPALVNLWLAAAAVRGSGLAPAQWPALAAAASRSSGISRPLVAQVLGERGRWFVAQNSAWARLAAALTAAVTDAPTAGPPASAAQPTVARAISPEAVLADPDLIFAAETPWPGELSRAALAVIGTGQLQRRTVGFASDVGLIMPLEHYPLVLATGGGGLGGRTDGVRDPRPDPLSAGRDPQRVLARDPDRPRSAGDTMSQPAVASDQLRPHAEVAYAAELVALAATDDRPRPPRCDSRRWRWSPT